MQGHFITIEGTEGMGKSTVLAALKAYFAKEELDALFTREPGGTPMAESIRVALLADYTESVSEYTELLLMFAARYQHALNVLSPALSAGRWVISDRYVDASYAYQGAGREIAFEKLDQLAAWIPNQIMPDVTLLLDAPVEVGLERIRERAEADRIEQEKVDFFKRVRHAYHQRAKAEPNRFVVIDASQPPEAVVDAVLAAVIDYRARVSC